MTQNNSEQFDPILYIDELIGEMGMQNEDPEKLSALKQAMLEALMFQILQAAKENIEPEVIDIVLEEMKFVKDPIVIMQELVQSSPSAQNAILAALNSFTENTLEAFNKLKV